MNRNILRSSLFSLLSLSLFASALLQTWPTSAASLPERQPTRQRTHLNSATTNLSYHGGPVMTGTVTTYAIFWEPTGSYVSPTYNSLILQYFNDVGSSPLYQNLTQYYSKHGKYPANSALGGFWVDKRPYPGSKITDGSIQYEVSHAMKVNGWTPSIHKLFVVFSAKGEIMCFNHFGYRCTFETPLCAWHSFFGTNTVYAAEPYAGTDLSLCGVPSSPNHDIDADSTINLITHEQMEAATDPTYSNGWYDNNSDGYHLNEIADKCVWVFGQPNQYGGDVIWNGHPYEVQEEWDNTSSSCVLAGP